MKLRKIWSRGGILGVPPPLDLPLGMSCLRDRALYTEPPISEQNDKHVWKQFSLGVRSNITGDKGPVNYVDTLSSFNFANLFMNIWIQQLSLNETLIEVFDECCKCSLFIAITFKAMLPVRIDDYF